MAHRVLYVEDDDANFLLVQRALEVTGDFIVERAATAAEAEERLREAEVDLLLVDLDLPDRDGVALVRDLDRQGIAARTPRMAISASVMKRERDRALAAGFRSFLSKPFLIADLRRAAYEAVGARPDDGGAQP